ncbi:hypothetical protein [Woodsholea maritima]|uniref:hypothetical protein n=1 Tax=Woodsholea maritima TaxID=240237 RepID=UPI0003A2879A|nr:hypothetical protein [Woodsholea maritima]
MAPVARERQSSPQARALPAPEPAGLASSSEPSQQRQALPQGRVHPVHLQLTRQGAGRGLRADRDERQRYVRTYQDAAKPARPHPPLISKVA